MECLLSELATAVASLYKVLAPEAYLNQVVSGFRANDCRIGYGSEKPFSGVTACLDFCAHSHRDKHNMDHGATLILTLKRPAAAPAETAGGSTRRPVMTTVTNAASHPVMKETRMSEDQLHVLSQYAIHPSHVDPYHMMTGSLSCLDRYRQRKRLRSQPLTATASRSARNLNLRRRRRVGKAAGGRDVSSMLTSSTTESAFSCGSKQILKHVNDLNETIYEIESENESDLVDGVGVGIALTHGSLLIECAKAEMHSTTAVPQPNGRRPSRLSLVFYQHKKLDQPRHGRDQHHLMQHMAPVGNIIDQFR